MPIDEFLKSIPSSPGTFPPVILIHASGHQHVALGIVDHAGGPFVQLVHGEASPSLVALSQLKAQGFQQAWRILHTGETSDLPIKIGETTLRVDRHWHNFGSVKPQTDVQTTFRLLNAGPHTIRLDNRPRTSCGCTTADTQSQRTLAPGELFDLTVTLQTGKSASLRHTIHWKLFEEDRGPSREIVLTVFANQPRSMKVVPESLDFGLIADGQPVDRTIRLSETHCDRFEILSVNTGGLPIQSSIESYATKESLITYRVRLRLNTESLPVGRHRGNITILTNSGLLPTAIVPFEFRIDGPIQVPVHLEN